MYWYIFLSTYRCFGGCATSGVLFVAIVISLLLLLLTMYALFYFQQLLQLALAAVRGDNIIHGGFIVLTYEILVRVILRCEGGATAAF